MQCLWHLKSELHPQIDADQFLPVMNEFCDKAYTSWVKLDKLLKGATATAMKFMYDLFPNCF